MGEREGGTGFMLMPWISLMTGVQDIEQEDAYLELQEIGIFYMIMER